MLGECRREFAGPPIHANERGVQEMRENLDHIGRPADVWVERWRIVAYGCGQRTSLDRCAGSGIRASRVRGSRTTGADGDQQQYGSNGGPRLRESLYSAPGLGSVGRNRRDSFADRARHRLGQLLCASSTDARSSPTTEGNCSASAWINI